MTLQSDLNGIGHDLLKKEGQMDEDLATSGEIKEIDQKWDQLEKQQHVLGFAINNTEAVMIKRKSENIVS